MERYSDEAMSRKKIHIIGMAPEGISSLSSRALNILEMADFIAGGERLLAGILAPHAEKFIIKNNLDKLVKLIKSRLGKKKIAVLASGDPNFFGIARVLVNNLGKEHIEILPNISSMQIAFARIRESWDDALFVSVHSRPIKEITETIRGHHKICIFTDHINTPAKIARELLKNGMDYFQAFVCEDLGSQKERIIETGLPHLSKMRCSPLNTLILICPPEKVRKAGYFIHFGIRDSEFAQKMPQKGLITKQEIRAISIAKLGLQENSVLWDIGAGSGAVSIEATSIVRHGYIYAIEKDSDDIDIIKQNIKKFGVSNIEIVQTTAPAGLYKLPAPDAVFIGGSGGRIKRIIKVVSELIRPGGRLVINLSSLENMNAAIQTLKSVGLEPEITLVNISHSVRLIDLTRLEPLNPVFIISCVKPEGK